jgi:hypothetical protein
MYNEVRVFLENSPGKLSRLAQLLGDAGIDILALELADEGQYGVFKILTAEPERAKEILSKANIAVALNQIVCVELPDQPGSLVTLSKVLEDAKLNVADAYGCILERGKRAVFIIKGDDLEAVEAAVRNAGLKVLNSLE